MDEGCADLTSEPKDTAGEFGRVNQHFVQWRVALA
jgi:hypothetical protein